MPPAGSAPPLSSQSSQACFAVRIPGVRIRKGTESSSGLKDIETIVQLPQVMNDANMPLRHGWLDLPHHEWQHGQPSGRTQPNPCGASNSHHHRPWVVTGPPEQTWLTRNRTFFCGHIGALGSARP